MSSTFAHMCVCVKHLVAVVRGLTRLYQVVMLHCRLCSMGPPTGPDGSMHSERAVAPCLPTPRVSTSRSMAARILLLGLLAVGPLLPVHWAGSGTRSCPPTMGSHWCVPDHTPCVTCARLCPVDPSPPHCIPSALACGRVWWWSRSTPALRSAPDVSLRPHPRRVKSLRQ